MFLHPDYNVCFTFAKDRDITRAGTEQGLRMLMTVNVRSALIILESLLDFSKIRADSPHSTFCRLPTVLMCEYSAMFGNVFVACTMLLISRGLLHLPGDHPDFTNDGFKIAARTQASIGFRQVSKRQRNHSRGPIER